MMGVSPYSNASKMLENLLVSQGINELCKDFKSYSNTYSAAAGLRILWLSSNSGW